MRFSGDKTDVTALVAYAQSLEAKLDRAEAILERVGDASFLDGTIYDAIRDAKRFCAERIT